MRPLALRKNVNVDHSLPNPFNPKSPKVFDDVALYEYIDSVATLATLIDTYNHICKRKDVRKVRQSIVKASHKHIIDSVLNQMMIAILIAQDKLSFVHNDLHFDNVLVSKCYDRTYIIYVFEKEGGTFRAMVPTYGYYPTIIDYGFSFTKDLNNGPLFTGIHHNNKGYMNYTYDEFTDFKTVLTRLVYCGYVKDRYYLEKIKSEIIRKLPIDRETGWDHNNSISISKYLVEYVREIIKPILGNSEEASFLERHDYEVVDIIGTLIVLPLEARPFDSLDEYLNIFVTEWSKIERWLGTSASKVHVLRTIVDRIRLDVTSPEDEDDKTIMHRFQTTIFDVMDRLSTKSLLRNLSYKDLYISLIKISECMEGIMYEQHSGCIRRKTREYGALKNLSSSLDMYSIFEGYITNDYLMELNDYIIVCDAVNETSYSFVVDDEAMIAKANRLPPSERANYFLRRVDP